MATLHTRTNLHRLLNPLLTSMIVTSISILTGIVPNLTAQQPSQIFASIAQADEFSDSDLQSYAAALVEIEPIRKSALAQVSQANGGGRLPNLVCSEPDTMSGLSDRAKSLFIDYCNQYASIAASRGMSVDRFNQITQAVRSSSQLKSRVRRFM